MDWIDRMIYKIFYWRWNPKFARDKFLRELFRDYLQRFEETSNDELTWTEGPIPNGGYDPMHDLGADKIRRELVIPDDKT